MQIALQSIIMCFPRDVTGHFTLSIHEEIPSEKCNTSQSNSRRVTNAHFDVRGDCALLHGLFVTSNSFVFSFSCKICYTAALQSAGMQMSGQWLSPIEHTAQCRVDFYLSSFSTASSFPTQFHRCLNWMNLTTVGVGVKLEGR